MLGHHRLGRLDVRRAAPTRFTGDGRHDGGEVERRSGNTDVGSEKGETWTFGAVFRSPFEHELTRGLSRDG